MLFVYTFFAEVLREIFVEQRIKRFDRAKKSIRLKESDPASLSNLQHVKQILMSCFSFFYLATRLPFTLLLSSILYPEVFCIKYGLKDFPNFTGKHLFESIFDEVAALKPATVLKGDCSTAQHSYPVN